MKRDLETSVLYNATCPVCNFEIQHYARYAFAKGLPIRFDDLNSDAREHWSLDADTAARRLYVLHDGKLTSGIPAFLVLWAQMPKYRERHEHPVLRSGYSLARLAVCWARSATGWAWTTLMPDFKA
ncbi:DCC1-like thiol-disulfide oxidoreductase family protein, partial [Aquibium sp. ELW1220]|uniref:DCC1-like thiol-disulfide oxidoreductase family protein n=1 Tax=Aquibium sp. ELW1220 TaxID=2976766 RepID=UPI0025B2284F